MTAGGHMIFTINILFPICCAEGYNSHDVLLTHGVDRTFKDRAEPTYSEKCLLFTKSENIKYLQVQ
jgi:hypothetical protein